MNKYSIFLKFKPAELEKEFCDMYQLEILPYIKIGVFTTLAAWLSAIILVVEVFPEYISQYLYVVFLVICPLCALILYVSYSKKWYFLAENVSTTGLFTGALFAIYLTYYLAGNDSIAMWFLTFYAFFPFVIYRLKVLKAVSVCVIYISFYIFLLYNSGRSSTEIFQFLFQILLAFALALVCGYVMEIMARRLFIQHKMIKERQEKLHAEQQLSERLLLNMIPNTIAQKLKVNQHLIAQNFEEVTVLFADIVGFTNLSGKLSPPELISMLNEVFSAFDDLVEKHGLEKIKTVGDKYIVAGGVPDYIENHAEAIAALAMDMCTFITGFKCVRGHTLEIRIGIHTGPLIAGIIGKKKFRYDLWGDTVNTAARLESHGKPGMIHVSENTYNLLREKFSSDKRGSIEIRSKGRMNTYFLICKKCGEG